ncbi:CHAT domain protein [Ceratobasidium sp. AG-Ba]|nr:CHAT domain protein [Ceratobasidium sp. AG-Ba]
MTLDGHHNKPGYLNNLGISCLRRFERLGEPADLDHAIQFQAQAASLIPDDHSDKPSHLSNLGNSWICRFESFGDLADLDRAVDCQTHALNLAPSDDPGRPAWLNNLGVSWLHRFKRLGKAADIDQAISFEAQAVDLTPSSHPDKPGRLSNLGNSWLCRFEHLGHLEDLDHAIEYQAQAVALTPDSHPDKPAHLTNLGNSWLRQFEHFGDTRDIDRAIEAQTQAVALTPDNHPNKVGRLSNLGNSWLCRFERLGKLEDLERAVDCQTQAVDLTPNYHPEKSGRLNNLGNSKLYRFGRIGELADLLQAIKCHDRAVALTPNDHPDKPGYLSNIGNSWLCQFERNKELADLGHAVESHSQAVCLTPDYHPNKSNRLFHLGNAWLYHFEYLGQAPALEQAINAFGAGATTFAFRPSIQIQCAQKWAEISVLLERSPFEAYQLAFSMLPRLVWIGHTVEQRFIIMTMVGDLVSQAAAWAISAQYYDLALEWLEQGRSIVWGQTLGLRTSLQDLSLCDFKLAQQLQYTATTLDSVGYTPYIHAKTPASTSDFVSQVNYRHSLALRWEELLARARVLPGCSDFMLPSKSTSLKQAATDGPIVIINTYLAQCDALIVLPQQKDLIHVPLPEVSQKKLDELCTPAFQFMSQKGSRSARWSTQIEVLNPLPALAFLWSGVVEPVLDSLSYTEKLNSDALPHITWCATGTMSFFPLHAAGLYNKISKNASDFVVSSYTPTLKALILHQEPSLPQMGLLAVGQEATPGLAPLPRTIEELQIFRKYPEMRCSQLEGVTATVSAALAGMEHHSWVHLACHASQSKSNPSHSAFHLHDGPLTLEEISKRQFKNKGLAYLSGCQTAFGDHELPDEAVHLAAGMLMAGYPSVIATAWSIMDEDAPFVAESVYSELLKDGKMDHTRSARALHKAVGKLRERVGDQAVWRWAPFVHIGV